MGKRIKILHLEDSLLDARYIRSFIENAIIDHEYFLAGNEKDFRQILETQNADIILSDYNLPDYDGNKALKVVREQYPHIPFIFVSGVMGEDAAIGAMLNGAKDFVLKSKLERLGPAIKRALHESELERERLQAVIDLKEKNKQIEAQNEKYIKINKELAFQNQEKEKRAAELVIANKELLFQNEEKGNRAAELIIANKELLLQSEEKGKRAAELTVAIKEIKKAKEKFRLVVESSSVAMILIDHQDHICFVNGQSEKLFGYEREELMGKRFDVLVPERFRNPHALKRKMSFIKKRWCAGDARREFFALGKNGIEIQVEISSNPIETIDGPMILVSIVDITARKIQEASRIKQLELEIKNRELEQFAYIASHDLREPLRTVANYIQIFEEDYLEQLDDKAHKYLQSVNDAIKRMSKLIKLLLDHSRLGQNSKLVYADSKKILEEVIADLDNLIQTSNTAIEVSEMPSLNVYETEIRELFQNLITNAIKFRKKGTTPKIKISSEKVNEAWKFSVSDNGIGIDSAHFDQVFAIFKRLHQNETEYEGNGIGLANCKKIVLLHQGEIWIDSTIDIGSTFHFTIPQLTA